MKPRRRRPRSAPARPDELLLAIALQEAHARRLKPIMGDYFADGRGNLVRSDDPTLRGCCAVGALVLAGVCELWDDRDGIAGEAGEVFGMPDPFNAAAIGAGNDDSSDRWRVEDEDRGETLGHAFQLAMGGYGRSWQQAATKGPK